MFNKVRLLLSLFIICAVSVFGQKADSTLKFRVSGVCGSCKLRIEKSVKVKGVSKPSWDASTQMMQLKYDPNVIPVDSIHSLIAGVGHDTELKKAPDDVYAELPDCCLYRDGVSVHSDMDIDSSSIAGVVVKEDLKGNFTPLMGANVGWLGDEKIVTSNDHGEFSIPVSDEFTTLVISFAGFRSDTIQVTEPGILQVVLGTNNSLKAVVVTSKQKNMYVNRKDPFGILQINSGELLKAACCNLSESFETNPSVKNCVTAFLGSSLFAEISGTTSSSSSSIISDLNLLLMA